MLFNANVSIHLKEFIHDSPDIEWFSNQEAEANLELTLAEQEIIRVTNELHSFADALGGRVHDEASRAMVYHEITEAQQTDALTESLRSGDYDDETLEEFVTGLHRLSQEHDLYIWDSLYQVPHEKLAELYNDEESLVADVVEGALRVGQNFEDSYLDSIQLANHVMKGIYGPAYTWREAGTPRDDLPDTLRDSVANSDFTKAALETIPLSENIQNPIAHITMMRKVQEKLLVDCMGVPRQIAGIYNKSLHKRTMNQNDDGMPIPLPLPGAGIDTEAWYDMMLSATEATKGLEAEEFDLLFDILGLVNYDRLNNRQVQTMLKLLRGDQTTIDIFRKADSVMLFIDVDGDYNNAMADDPERFDDRVPTIFAELHSPIDVYRRPIYLNKKTGIQPSTLAFSVHGDPGVMSVREKPNVFEFATWKDNRFDPLRHRTKNRYDVRDAQGWAKFVRKYMRPHSQTGERTILLLSCSQASAPKGGYSIPEVLISKTEIDDNVRIRAPKEPTTVQENDKGDLRFYDIDKGLFTPSYDARLARTGANVGSVIIQRSTKALV